MSHRPLVALAAVALVACQAERDLGPERTRANAFVYTAPMAAGQTLTLRNFAGAVLVEPATDDTLRVSADLHWRGDSTPPTDVSFRSGTTTAGIVVCAMVGDGRCSAEDYDVKSDGSGISIGRGRVRLGMGGTARASVQFTVRVPAGVRLDLVMIDGTIRSASSAPVKARGVNGNITVVTSVGPVQAKTVNGDVDIRMTTLSGADSVQAETVNGAASAYVPADVSAAVEVRVTNGSALSDFPGLSGGAERISKVIAGTLGAGTTPVRVRSLNGNAQLRRLDATGRPIAIPAP